MRHITCGIYLISKNDKLLICHPTGSGTEWSISKGKVESGEESFDTAVRETYEETGIQVNFIDYSIPHQLPSRRYRSGRKTLKSFVLFERKDSSINIEDFVCYCDSTVGSTDKPEMDEYRWVSLDEASKLLHESQVENLKIIRKMVK